MGWYRQFVKFHSLRHPETMGSAEVEAFLTYLAVTRGVVAATQNQALNALFFLFREVLKKEFEGVDAMRAKQSRRLPVVLSVLGFKIVRAGIWWTEKSREKFKKRIREWERSGHRVPGGEPREG